MSTSTSYILRSKNSNFWFKIIDIENSNEVIQAFASDDAFDAAASRLRAQQLESLHHHFFERILKDYTPIHVYINFRYFK